MAKPKKDRDSEVKGTKRKSKNKVIPLNDDTGVTQIIFSRTGSMTAINEAGVEIRIPHVPSKENLRADETEDTVTSLIDKKYLHRDPQQQPKGKSAWKLWKRRLYAVVWINLIIRFRKPSATLAEIFIAPAILCIFLVSLTRNFNYKLTARHEIELTTAAHDNNGTTQSMLLAAFCKNPMICRKGAVSKAYIVYTPSNHITDRIMNGVLQDLNIAGQLVPMKSEDELVAECLRRYNERQAKVDFDEPNPIGIIFTLDGLDPPSLLRMPIPHIFTYAIRTFEASIVNTKELFPYFSLNEVHDISPYIKTGFAGVQTAIDRHFMLVINDQLQQINVRFINSIRTTISAFLDDAYVKTRLRVFPYTLYFDKEIRRFTWFIVVFTIYLGYFLTTYIMARKTIVQRQTGILEILKLHGMPSYMDRLVILFNDGCLRGLTAAGITIILFSTVVKDEGFYRYDYSGLVWLFVVLHGVSNIAFTFCLALFFKRPTFGACSIFLIGFVSFFIPMSLYNAGTLTSKTSNAFLCILFPNWCLANGLYNFLKFESLENGQTWWSISTWVDTDNYVLFPVLFCCLLMIWSTTLYSFLAIYLDKVTNNPLSAKESCLFCFKADRNYVEKEEEDDEFERPPVYEPESEPVLIKCRNLSFIYPHTHDKVVLDNVSIDIHENQVTILLGKSGCGKTTLLKTIAGLVKPLRGYARLKNLSTTDNPENLRHYVGYSPQKHILYETLTVQESIRLCCMLHGREHLVAKLHAAALMLRFGLYLSKDVGVKHLSECQKRKLSISMSLASNPAVLVLDEPTCGMTPMEKREIWHCIRVLKQGRCIVVTANTMDEADLYGDRIILMAKGRIVCVGSPGFLKERYSTGSYVRLRTYEGFDLHVPSVQQVLKEATDMKIDPVHPNLLGHARDLCFPIPKDIPVSICLAALEKSSTELGICNISLTHVTLAGILGHLASTPEFHNENFGYFVPETAEVDTGVAMGNDAVIKMEAEIPVLGPDQVKKPYWCMTVSAIFTKQVMATIQNTGVLYQYIVPLLLLAIFVFSIPQYLAVQPKETSIRLSVQTYAEPLFPIWLPLHGADENKVWNEAVNDVSGETHGRNVIFDTNELGGEEFQQILYPAIGSRTKYKSQVAVGLSRTFEFLTGYYASNALHAAPCALNYMSNLMLYLVTPDLDISANIGHENRLRKEYPINIVALNHPFQSEEAAIGTVRDTFNSILGIIFALVIGMLAATKLSYCLDERSSGLKYLQIMNGVTPFQYWTVTFICDIVANNVLTLIVMAILCLFETGTIFDGVDIRIGFYALTTLFLAWASLPYGYLISNFVGDKFSGYGLYMAWHIGTGIIPEIFNSLILDRITRDPTILQTLHYTFLVFPAYSLNAGFVLLIQGIAELGYCKTTPAESQQMCRIFDYLGPEERTRTAAKDPYIRACCDKYCKAAKSCIQPVPVFAPAIELSHLSVQTCLYSMIIQGFFFWFLLLIIDYQIFQRFQESSSRYFSGLVDRLEAKNVTGKTIDAEYAREADAGSVAPDDPVEGTISADTVLDVHGITKYFKTRRVLNHIYFNVKKGDILGIMGEDNSGKTVLIRIITGDLRTTLGTATICGMNLIKNHREYLTKLAYCPQTNAIHQFLTGLQMMQLMGRLRGIPVQHLNRHARHWLKLVGFDDKLMHSQCGYYPPGVQRRLCGAMTLIGNCEILIFDDPTDSLDAIEHMSFWNIIELVRSSGQSVIFTSKSSQECVQMTTKLVILANGELQARGNPHEIYESYPKKWSLVIRFKHALHGSLAERDTQEGVELVRVYIASIFPRCELKEELDNFLLYHIDSPDDRYPLSHMYHVMETAKKDMPELIDDYFIEETSLDDLFGTSSEDFQLKLSRSTLSDKSEELLEDRANVVRPKNRKILREFVTKEDPASEFAGHGS